jgi:hypothetical protein
VAGLMTKADDLRSFTIAGYPQSSAEPVVISGGHQDQSQGKIQCAFIRDEPSFDSNAPGPNWPLPDTNQRTCYNNSAALGSCPGTAGSLTCGDTTFCGQDAQYGWDLTHTAAERFTRTATAEPVVTDNVTGLIWQGCAAGLTGSSCGLGSASRYTWGDALAYCDSLSWGGSSNWRLPDEYELHSIIDYGRSSGVDPTAFPATPYSLFWSSSSYDRSPSSAWLVPFTVGSDGCRADKTELGLGHKPGHRTSPPSPLSDTERGSRTCFSVGVPPFPRREGGTGGLGLWPDP